MKRIGQAVATTMSVPELLGVAMVLLWKLSLSVAAALLLSWAFRFYASRGPQGDRQRTTTATCSSCKTALAEAAQEDADQEPAGASPSEDGLSLDNEDRAQEDTRTLVGADGNEKYKNSLSHQEHAEASRASASPTSPVNRGGLSEGGPAPTPGRCPPGPSQSLEAVVGPPPELRREAVVAVCRELRRELEWRGAYSSFLSKAEIKVEDAGVLLEGGEPTVRRKIYDYHVESSSHCLLGRSPSQPAELEGSGSRLSSSSSTSPITICDVGFLAGLGGDPSGPERPERPVLLRKDSYRSATERWELPLPLQTSGAPAAAPQSPVPQALDGSSEDSTDPDERHMRRRGTAARSPSLHRSSNQLERLPSRVDLGNCLEALDWARKHRRTSLQQVALKVMSDNYLQVLKEPSVYGRLLAGERAQIQQQRMRGPRLLMVAHVDPQGSGGAETEPRTSGAVYYYDHHADAWHHLCLIPQEVASKACAACTMDNYLFLAVGCQGARGGTAPSKRVFCFNPLTSIWKEIGPMNEARPCCKLAAVDGHVYAIGGECLSSVERYDPREDKWTFVAPLPNNTFAVGHHVSVSNGELYVSGGTLKCLLLCYSPKTNSWRSSLLAGSGDKSADMVAVGRCLYRFDVNPVLGLSVFRYHTGVRLWYECSSRRLPRCPAFHCVALDDSIFCVSRRFTMRFVADEISPAFTDQRLSVVPAATGTLLPFVLCLPERTPLQTSV